MDVNIKNSLASFENSNVFQYLKGYGALLNNLKILKGQLTKSGGCTNSDLVNHITFDQFDSCAPVLLSYLHVPDLGIMTFLRQP